MHLRTHFLGCEKKDHIPKPDGHILRLDIKNCWAYANILDQLASACHLAHTVQNLTDQPFKVSVLLPFVKYRKSIDKSTNLDVVNFLINKMKPTKNGIIWDVFQTNMDPKVITPFSIMNVWPFVDKWSPKDYISVQRPEEKVKPNKLEPLMEEWGKLEKVLETYKKYPIKYVDYTMDISDVYDIILGTRLHISYTGASYWIASNAKVPMIAFGPNADKIVVEENVPHSLNRTKINMTQYGIHSPYNWMRNYDVNNETPESNYKHLIYNIRHVNSNIENVINDLTNIQSGDRDMWFM